MTSSTPHQPLPPRFPGNINFHAQHSPMGAFMSFTCGNFSARGAFGLQIGKPGNQDLYIGIKDGDRFSHAPLRCLPFYQGAGSESDAAAFQVEQAATPAEQGATPRVIAYRADEIARHYGWGTDAWVTKDLSFRLYTPFASIPDPATADALQMRSALCPAVVAELVIDNRSERTRTAVFAIKFPDAGVTLTKGLGFAWRGQAGARAELASPAAPAPFAIQRWDPALALCDPNPVHMLGNTAGFALEIPPGQVRRLRIALGVYLPGVVTTRIEGRYLYTRCFGGLDDVLDYALAHHTSYRDAAIETDEELAASGLSADQQFLIAHATRSYYGSTQLLDVGGQPFWIVNEGEYCMMNTLDLSVDQVFWELDRNPWVVRNLLDNFVHHYSYVDQVKVPGPGDLKPGGISFTHDMGAHNNFSSSGHSSYELTNLNAVCFSHMTAEQLCNWILIAACYVARTGDIEWARRNEHTIAACLTSLVNRGGDAGFCQFDSSRCGPGGAEITTYDSLDHSLAQTRNNLYMATKSWAGYLGLSILLRRLDRPQLAEQAYDGMLRVARWVARQAKTDVLPAVFEPDNPGYHSRILPAVEGLMYPLYWDQCEFNPEAWDDLFEHADNRVFLNALTRHVKALLADSQKRNFFPDGGLRLSSTSNNSWASKIAIFMHVAREALYLDDDPEIRALFARADAAHVKWQTDGSSYWACSDQFVSGEARASRYYPRIITTALWLNSAHAQAQTR